MGNAFPSTDVIYASINTIYQPNKYERIFRKRYAIKPKPGIEMEPGVITFTVIYQQEVKEVSIEKGHYFSLMSLLSEQLHVPGFGLCSGMGSCGTCEVLVRGRSVPACTVPVDHALNGSIVNIDAANAF